MGSRFSEPLRKVTGGPQESGLPVWSRSMPHRVSVTEALRRTAARLLAHIPPKRLDLLDAIVQEAQGKGWGYSGVLREVAGVRACLEVEGHSSPSLIFDVGANVGDWAAAARSAWPTSEIVCFEPSEVAGNALKKRFVSDERIRVVATAVGATEGWAELYGDLPGSPLSSLRQRRLEHFDVHLEPQESVQVRTLDSHLSICGGFGSVDVIKIDVEGAEMDVLRGAERCLESVKAVQFEWGEASTGSPLHWVDYWYFWKDRGFKLYRIYPRGILKVDHYHPRDEVMTWTNYIAVRSANA